MAALKEIEYSETGMLPLYKLVLHVRVHDDGRLTVVRADTRRHKAWDVYYRIDDEAPVPAHLRWIREWEKFDIRHLKDNYESCMVDGAIWRLLVLEEGEQAREIRGWNAAPRELIAIEEWLNVLSGELHEKEPNLRKRIGNAKLFADEGSSPL